MIMFHVKHVHARGERASLRARLSDAADPRPVFTSLVHGETVVECEARDARRVLAEIVSHAAETAARSAANR